MSSMSSEKTVCINPATGETIGEYRVNTLEELNEAAAGARRAQPLWATVPLKERARLILKTRRFIVDHLDELAEIISRDNGKTRMDALMAEGLPMAMAVSYYCKMAPAFLKDKKIAPSSILYSNRKSFITQKPFGVVGIISPWNYPASIPFSEIICALLAGNTVIFKCASETQVVGHFIKHCLESAGLPEHVFNYINLPGRIAGDAFLTAGIDKLFFTGSVSVGKYLMKKASERLVPVSLELGGNDPMIVCEDADLYRAVKGAVWAGLQNAGQSCGGVERIYVHQSVYAEFLAMLKTEVEALRIGPDEDFNVDIGAMTTERQMDTVRLHIEDALAKGATIFARSDPPYRFKGQFLPCMVLTDVHHDMLVMKDETFGPVLGVMPYRSIDEAIALANDSHLGLTASIWSKNTKKATAIGRKIMAGAITINDHLFSQGLAETPWGGFKESGIGRTHGALGFAEMTQPQVIVKDTMPFVRKNFWWHPFSREVYEGTRGIAYFLYGRGFKQRIKGLAAFMKVFPRTFVGEKVPSKVCCMRRRQYFADHPNAHGA